MEGIYHVKKIAILKEAISNGKLFKIHYNEYPFVLCQQDVEWLYINSLNSFTSDDLTSVEIIDNVKSDETKK
jgi:hypothetical protein